MILVTLTDACLRLPELIGMVAAGEDVVIIQNGVTLAALTPPPFVLRTQEEEEIRRAKALASMDDMRRWCAEDGIPYPGDDPAEQLPKPESPAA